MVHHRPVYEGLSQPKNLSWSKTAVLVEARETTRSEEEIV
jgi:hypothetical protein